MYIRLINIGKTTVPYLKEGELEYEKRLKHYLKFERIDLKELKSSKKQSHEILKKNEAELILKTIKPNDVVIILDEQGADYSSEDFSKWLNKKEITGLKQLIFIIGGAYGFDKSIYERANEKLSISKMTFSHQMIRLLFLEQLYRAKTILNGEKYHHS
ncbi:23S rRNA (pseudouridine(1915)-N(3))-methyltransferase RlmH [Crocinitomicaceae bacterium]|nr:23S rRNA (pseudouridine(1915)-N(3))-methyltransferase RlmH [Crocinitomicaceae bacterium]